MRADGWRPGQGGGLWLVPGQQCASVCVFDQGKYFRGLMLAIFEAFYCPFTVNLSGKMASRLAPSGLLSRGATVRLMAVPQCPAGWKRRHFIKKKSLWFSALRAFFSAVKLHTLFKMIRSHENVPLALCHLELFEFRSKTRQRGASWWERFFFLWLVAFIGSQHLLSSFSHASMSRCES